MRYGPVARLGHLLQQELQLAGRRSSIVLPVLRPRPRPVREENGYPDAWRVARRAAVRVHQRLWALHIRLCAILHDLARDRDDFIERGRGLLRRGEAVVAEYRVRRGVVLDECLSASADLPASNSRRVFENARPARSRVMMLTCVSRPLRDGP